MTSKIKENILFYLSSTRERSRSIAIGHDLELKNDLIIKILIKNCRFKFDLMLIDGLKSKYSDLKFENIYSAFEQSTEQNDLNHLYNDLNVLNGENDVTNLNDLINLDKKIDKLKSSIQTVYPESGLIVESINLFVLNKNAIDLNNFINFLLSKYSKVIFLFNFDLIDDVYLNKIKELSTAYFNLNRKSLHSNEIEIDCVYKKKCSKLGLDLVKDVFQFTYDSNLMAKLNEKSTKTDATKSTDNYSYDLSFNLNINDDKQRENVLPFMRYV